MSSSERRVVDDAPKECGGAEHVVSKVTYLAVCFLDHPKIFEKRTLLLWIKHTGKDYGIS